jgi:hypothetical protein
LRDEVVRLLLGGEGFAMTDAGGISPVSKVLSAFFLHAVLFVKMLGPGWSAGLVG